MLKVPSDVINHSEIKPEKVCCEIFSFDGELSDSDFGELVYDPKDIRPRRVNTMIGEYQDPAVSQELY